MTSSQVQMRALVRAETMIGGLNPRQVFWCTEAVAQHFLEHRIAELIAPLPAPHETKPAEPSVLKTEESPPKKSLVEEPVGLSTDSVKSNESGTVRSYASQLARALTTPKRNPSTLTLPKRK